MNEDYSHVQNKDAEHMSHHVHAGNRGAAGIPGPTSRDLYRKRFIQPRGVIS